MAYYSRGGGRGRGAKSVRGRGGRGGGNPNDKNCWYWAKSGGKCKYGDRCNWRHTDTSTGQVMKTLWASNSLYQAQQSKFANSRNGKKATNQNDNENTNKTAKSDTKTVNNTNNTNTNTAKASTNDNNTAKDDEKTKVVNNAESNNSNNNASKNRKKVDDDDEKYDPKELQQKFSSRMEKAIEMNKDKPKQQVVHKLQPSPAQKQTSKKVNANAISANKPVQSINKQDVRSVNSKHSDEKPWIVAQIQENRGYANYGTTMDQFGVCWEFNSYVGCRKGAQCKWPHLYLRTAADHPYTGVKLEGMAVKKFRTEKGI